VSGQPAGVPHPAAFAFALALLAVVLAVAMVRPRALPEALAAVPAAGLLVMTGVLPWRAAVGELASLGPTVGFLAAILLLGQLCADEGVFAAAGALMARASRADPRRLLGLVFAVGAAVTAVLSLDATVVLLTPVVFATARTLRVPARPHVYACTHLANSGSLPLPVSNLTNLLVFGALGLSFTHFALLMTAPWLAVLAVEYAAFRWYFRGDLPRAGRRAPATVAPAPVPVFALVTVALTLAGFAAGSPLGIAPVWPAVAGAVVLAVRALARGRTTVRRLVAEVSPGFCAFVLGLAVIVRAVEHTGLDRLIDSVLPSSATLPALLAMAGLAAVLANLVNNLPAVLVLAHGLADRPHATGLLLAVLIGVNVGPNLTYAGSLATLLWRRILRRHDTEPHLGEFLRLGVLTVPAGLVVGVVALWTGISVFGA
jgi:arsenical pump membrane protein